MKTSLAPADACRRIIWSGVWLLVIFLAGQAAAQPLNIAVSSAQYATFVSGTVPSNGVFMTTSRMTLVPSPFSDDLIVQGVPMYGGESRASAGLFGVEAFSGVFGGQGQAAATNVIDFSPLADQTQTVGLQFDSAYRYYTCSGSVSLYDQTANLELWNYNWNTISGNVPWTYNTPGGSASAALNVDTSFQASHQYELTMIAGAQSASDNDECQIQFTGLQAIPEPAGVGLLLMALPGFVAVRRLVGR